MIGYPTEYASGFLPQRYVEGLGYEVILIWTKWLETSNAIFLIEEEHPNLFEANSLANFDVVAIAIANLSPVNIFISKAFIDSLKEKVKLAEIKKGSPIRVVGINFKLSGKEFKDQADIFDGLFIGKNMAEKIMRKCLG